MPKRLSEIRTKSKRQAADILARRAERLIRTAESEHVKTGEDLSNLALVLHPDIYLERRAKAQGRDISKRGK